MPTGIKHRDKNIAVTQESEFGQLTQMRACGPHESLVRSEVGSTGPEAMLVSKSSYTGIDTMPGVL